MLEKRPFLRRTPLMPAAWPRSRVLMPRMQSFQWRRAAIHGEEVPQVSEDKILPCRNDFFENMLEATGAAHFASFGGGFIYANPAFQTLTGYGREELSSMDADAFFSCVSPGAVEHVTIEGEGDAARRPRLLEARIKTRAGEMRWVQISTRSIEYMRGTAVIGALMDITEYKHREEDLSRSEHKYRTVFEFAPDVIVIYNKDGVPVDMNPMAARMCAEGVVWDTRFIHHAIARPQRLGEKDVWPAEEEKVSSRDMREQTLRDGEWFGEVVASRRDGREWFVETRAKLAKDGDEAIIIVISRDITDRKRMEKEIRASLREKETLLREIHHRVKNNMQIILSLLKLQLRNAEDAKTKALFRESQNRILSMAMIHEKLYQSEGLHRIDLKDYIGDLAQEVFASFGLISERVALKTAVESIAIGLDTAIPCGLIIIELISNALKYAFPEGRNGEVCICFRSEDQGWFRLTVSDNGVGLKEGIDINELRSLGLRLVSDLAIYQLEGELALSRAGGTTVHVRFKEKEKHQS